MKVFQLAASALLSISDSSLNNPAMKGRRIERVVKGTKNGSLTRLVGSVDMDGAGTDHPLSEVDPFILLDGATIEKDNYPPFGIHPHRGHSVVTVLLEGKMSSWDSVEQTKHFIEGPASYWVDAGAGVFHDELSVIKNDSDIPPRLFQLWVGVKEEDRSKPPRIQRDENLPKFDCKDGSSVVGNGIYHVGDKTAIETPHSITVAHISQNAGTTYCFPVEPDHGGFVVSMKGKAIFGGVESDDDDVLVLADEDHVDMPDFLKIESKESSEYLVCSGEKIREAWVKKLVANGALIAASEEQARELAPKVEAMSKTGKEGGSFAPFGV